VKGTFFFERDYGQVGSKKHKFSRKPKRNINYRFHTLKINSYTHRVVTLGILVYRDFLKYLIAIQEFTICVFI
jgi:hypothetical protein